MMETFSLSLPFSILADIFPDEPGLAGYIGAKDDGSDGNNWSYKTCKAPVKCDHQQTNTQLNFLHADALHIAQPTVSKH